jgi:hypothetical protein
MKIKHRAIITTGIVTVACFMILLLADAYVLPAINYKRLCQKKSPFLTRAFLIDMPGARYHGLTYAVQSHGVEENKYSVSYWNTISIPFRNNKPKKEILSNTK